MGVRDFSDADALFDDVERFIERAVIGVVHPTHDALTELNPVLTGHSQANWLASIGAPDPEVEGDPDNPAFGAGRASMQHVAETWRLFKGDIWIANNVDYVVILNRAHRTAQGFVEIAIERGIHVGGAVNE